MFKAPQDSVLMYTSRRPRATIHHLPLELLSAIFIKSLPPDPRTQPNSAQSPLLLGEVSKSWRVASLSTPELWTSFHLDLFEPYYIHQTTQLISVLRSWIARAGSLSLHIGLYIPSTYAHIVEATTPLVHAFLSYSHQCRSLSLKFGHASNGDNTSVPYHAYPFNQLPSCSFPLLEEIELELPFRNADVFHATVCHSMSHRLRKISLSSSPPCLLTFMHPLVLRQLTHLHLAARAPVSLYHNILRLTPELREAEFDLRALDDPHHLPQIHILDSAIVHRQLRELTVGPTNFAQFFNSVTFPGLRKLHINGEMKVMWDFLAQTSSIYHATWGQPQFISFLKRSTCPIVKLSLKSVNISSDDLINCLRAVSSTLVELEVESPDDKFINDIVLDALNYRRCDSQQFLCPLMERLRFGSHTLPFSGPVSSMLEMLESRVLEPLPAQQLSRLRYASIRGRFDFKQKQRIEGLLDQGLESLDGL